MDSPDTGQPVSVTHIRPKTKDDLERRRMASKAIADASVGMMGRTPDYLNYTFACFAARADVWARYGNEQGAENLVALREPHARQRPVARRTRSSTRRSTARCPRPTRPAARSRCTRSATRRTGSSCAARACSPRSRRSPTSSRSTRARTSRLQDGKYAICFSIPMSTPGLKFVCRDSFSSQRDPWDYPLSTRFDEMDAVVIFDDVEIPRDRIFLDGDATAPHGGHHRLALARAHHPPGHDARLGEARVRVRARPHDRGRSPASRSSTTCRRSSARSGR